MSARRRRTNRRPGKTPAGHARDGILAEVVRRVLAQYTLDPAGTHGVGHWARVLENGRRLARTTGANLQVVELFAVLHDSCRFNEGRDQDHGIRGADLAHSMNGDVFHLDEEDAHDLYVACSYHTGGRTDGNETVLTCWDADRLDLARVGIWPDPDRLCTEAARKSDVLDWATRRGEQELALPWVRKEWGVDLR